MNKNIIIVLNINDAKYITRKKISKFNILPLTPNTFNFLKKNNTQNLINPSSLDFDQIYYETMNKIILIDNLIQDKLSGIDLKPFSKEFIKFQINVFMSSFISLYLLIKLYKNIIIIDSDNLHIIKNIDNHIELIFKKMFEFKPFDYFFPTHGTINYKFNFITKLHNYFLKIFLSNKNIIFSSGEEYGMNYINNNLQSYNKESYIIKLGHHDNKYFTIIKNFVNFFLFKKKFSILPCANIKHNYSNKIKILFNVDNKELKLAQNLLIGLIEKGVNYLENTQEYLLNYFSNSKILFYFAHQIKMSNSLLLADIAKSKNAKIFLISHGIHSCSKNFITQKALEFNANGMLISPFSDYSLIQSKIAKQAFKNYNNNKKSINTYPLMWGNKNIYEAKSDKVTRKNKIILHASTFKSFNVRPWIYESSFEYINSLNKIISKIKNLKDITLIIRLRPTFECNYDTLENLITKSSNVILKKDGTFLDDLKKATLLISYSSTTIEEALYERVPVAIYANSIRFNHFEEINKKNTSKRSAVYTLSDQNMELELKKIVKDHFNQPLSDEELENYIWTKDDLELQSFNQFKFL